MNEPQGNTLGFFFTKGKRGVIVLKEKKQSEKNAVKNRQSDIFDILSDRIKNCDSFNEDEKQTKLERLDELRNQKVNILIAGATGAGKSSTVNAMFDANVADVGEGADPKTQELTSYELGNLVIWDSPGFGEGINDTIYAKLICKKLKELDENGNPLIDLVLVILDASSKDLGTSISLINDTIIPTLGRKNDNRILIGINQADMAMKGRHWDEDKNEPDEVLKAYLNDVSQSVVKRIKEATDVTVEPVIYCAGYTENGIRREPYNLIKLLSYIVEKIPTEKRLAIADRLNKNESNWEHDDHESDYKAKTFDSFMESIKYHARLGSCRGSEIGEDVLGIPGYVIGAALGGVFGAMKGLVTELIG